jgi:F-type H+-transporting ATPase subunit b
MEIDWFTLAAQIVNFLVLVFLLQHFLFDRVTGAMDERERRIASRIDEAEKKLDQAKEQQQELQRRQRELEESREGMMARAREEAAQQKRTLVEQAREEVADWRRRWQRAIRQQRRAFLATLRDRVGREIVQTAREVLEDLASEELESRTVETFIRYVNEMGKEEQEKLRSFLEGAESSLLIRSSFDLPEPAGDRVIRSLEQASGLKLAGQVRFERFTPLLLGIELRADGRSVGWNLDRYLDILSERLEDVLESSAEKNQEKREGNDDNGR